MNFNRFSVIAVRQFRLDFVSVFCGFIHQSARLFTAIFNSSSLLTVSALSQSRNSHSVSTSMLWCHSISPFCIISNRCEFLITQKSFYSKSRQMRTRFNLNNCLCRSRTSLAWVVFECCWVICRGISVAFWSRRKLVCDKLEKVFGLIAIFNSFADNLKFQLNLRLQIFEFKSVSLIFAQSFLLSHYF